ncbi:unnamed protein product [Citrullus colocynthis]|uniref:Uncharacterized protein n=1 Tax=Citrullus colocynthis TaxID=252529 RepID=A0ABP0YBM8_9ROSI
MSSLCNVHVCFSDIDRSGCVLLDGRSFSPFAFALKLSFQFPRSVTTGAQSPSFPSSSSSSSFCCGAIFTAPLFAPTPSPIPTGSALIQAGF